MGLFIFKVLIKIVTKFFLGNKGIENIILQTIKTHIDFFFYIVYNIFVTERKYYERK